jgi:DNA repair photolyase
VQAIYQPKGAAREYGEYACNLYRGCTNGCRYCYGPAVLRIPREEFHASAVLRPGIMAQLDKDAAKLPKGTRVHMCFTCDPAPERGAYPLREALGILDAHGLAAQVLTKNPGFLDLNFLQPGRDELWTTISTPFDDEADHWEPGAEIPSLRLKALWLADQRGITTRISLEPVVNPSGALVLLDRVKDMGLNVAEIKVGKWNYCPEAGLTNWPALRVQIADKARALGLNVTFKESMGGRQA